jgi:hypothetical protein
MNNCEVEIIGKPVKDMYGAPMGKILGTSTDVDGSIQTVGINCGSEGLKQIAFDQLVVQSEVVIFIPKWRLDSQRLLKQKELVIRRLNALMEIVSDNDSMKSDAEIIHEKYNTKLMTLQRTEYEINSELDNRVVEIEEQEKSVKVLLFDAKVQFKSNEISQETFDLVQKETDEMLQHMKHEKDEIAKVKSRLANLSLEDMIPKVSQSSVMPGTYLKEPSECEPTETRLPEPPCCEPSPEEPSETQVMTIPPQDNAPAAPESDWIKRMNSQ